MTACTGSHKIRGRASVRMSGLFNYYLRCPSCTLTSPTMSLAGELFDPRRRAWPTVNLEAGDFETTEVVVDTDDDAQAVRCIAALSTPTRRLSRPRGRFRDGGDLVVRLDPPLPCPRCGVMLEEGLSGSPPAIERELGSAIEAIEATRDAPIRARFLLTIPTDGLVIAWSRSVDQDEARVHRWRLHRRGESDVDLAALVARLVARLRELGSRCSEPRIRSGTARFDEWPGGGER